MLPEFCEGAVVQARMRLHLVVVASPLFDDHARIASGSEPLHVQALVAQPFVEAIVGAVLPRLPRRYCPRVAAALPPTYATVLVDQPLQWRSGPPARSGCLSRPPGAAPDRANCAATGSEPAAPPDPRPPCTSRWPRSVRRRSCQPHSRRASRRPMNRAGRRAPRSHLPGR